MIIKRCPFCGEMPEVNAHSSFGTSITCPDCSGKRFMEEKDAWKQWNTRYESNQPKQPRKIIQIHTVVENVEYSDLVTTALCNDGTVWKIDSRKEWHRLPPIPQDEE